MFDVESLVSFVLGNVLSGLVLGVAMYFLLLYALTYVFGAVDAVAVALVGGLIVFSLFMFGFDDFVRALLHSDIDGEDGAINKGAEFMRSMFLMAGVAAGFGGAYKLNR